MISYIKPIPENVGVTSTSTEPAYLRDKILLAFIIDFSILRIFQKFGIFILKFSIDLTGV